MDALARLYPEEEERVEHPPVRAEAGPVTGIVPACSSGYVQGIDQSALQSVEKRCGVGLEILAVPGVFIVKEEIIAKARGGMIDEAGMTEAAEAFTTGRERTLDQDPSFGFAMLTEMAVRAVSPSMNDPYTSMQCIDRIREALTFLAKRRYPAESLWPLPTFVDLLDQVWKDLIYYGRENPPVVEHLSQSLGKLRAEATRPADLAAIDRWLQRSAPTI